MSSQLKDDYVLVVNDKNYPLLVDLIPVLIRAGFKIDLVSANRMMKYSKFIHHFFYEKNKKFVPALLKKLLAKKEYRFVVITTDSLLKVIANSDLDDLTKIKLLPINDVNCINGLYSKVELSKKFKEINCSTPNFEIIESKQSCNTLDTKLKFPVLVKLDSSGAGLGVFECSDRSELLKTIEKIDDYPLLIQEKIDGELLDASAVYQDGNLIYFTYSKIEKEMYKFGPSTLRTYYGREKYTEELIHELRLIGEALGINGFTNISLIRANHKNYYFEVDIRPNVWINHGYYIGHDCSEVLSRCFIGNDRIRSADELVPEINTDFLLPHYLRVNVFDLLVNRHKVWYYIPANGWFYLICRKLKNLRKLVKNVVTVPFNLIGNIVKNS